MLNLLLGAQLFFKFDYIVINFFLIFAFYVCGNYVSIKKNNYWLGALVAIIMFVIVTGIRYNRGNDYQHYIDVYLNDTEDGQLLFTLFNQLCREVFAVSEYFIFSIYGIIFAICAMIFFKPLKLYAKYTFPLFIISFQFFEEYQIRQAFSYSFVFLYMNELFFKTNHKKRTKIVLCVIYAIISFSIHSANILYLFVLSLSYVFFKKKIPLTISIPLYLFASYLFAKYVDLSPIQNVVILLGNYDSKFAQYAEHADHWFGEGGFVDEWSRNPIVKHIETLANVSLIYWGHYSISKLGFNFKYERVFTTLYNMFVVGVIGRMAFLNWELLARMSELFMHFWFIPLISLIIEVKDHTIKLNFIQRISLLFLPFLAYEHLKLIFASEPHLTLYLWDK